MLAFWLVYRLPRIILGPYEPVIEMTPLASGTDVDDDTQGKRRAKAIAHISQAEIKAEIAKLNAKADRWLHHSP
jgi:hypothetical protein